METTEQEPHRYLRDLKNQVLSMQYVKTNAHGCPNCGMGIEKDGGCDRMFCIYCNTRYIHDCRSMKITYNHFNAKGHELFDESAISEWEWIRRDHQKRQVLSNIGALLFYDVCECRQRIKDDSKSALFFIENIVSDGACRDPGPYDLDEQFWEYKRCPVCSSFQPKTDRDNLIHCFICLNRYCFLCLAVLPKKNPEKHFENSRCRQHS